jgi:hypothetical protein
MDTIEFLVAYWLRGSGDPEKDLLSEMTAFAERPSIAAPSTIVQEVFERVKGHAKGADVGGYIVVLNFVGHPHSNWNFLIDAVAVAQTDAQLRSIAAGPAEHLFAHYGSLIELFEDQAARDPKFARMLTGAWRHRASDDVWRRIRAIQRAVPDPLAAIPGDDEDEEHAEKMKPEDRLQPDKGWFRLTKDGTWMRRRRDG